MLSFIPQSIYKTKKMTLALRLVCSILLLLTACKIWAAPIPYWHCGADEDGCVESSCLCIPQDLPANRPYCLDFDKADHPCQRATPEQAQKGICTDSQPTYPSQQACLNEYFSGGHCTAHSPFGCSLICNKGGEQCHKPSGRVLYIFHKLR